LVHVQHWADIGQCTAGDLYLSAKLAVVGSLLSVILSLLFLSNDNFIRSPADSDEQQQHQHVLHLFATAHVNASWFMVQGDLILGFEFLNFKKRAG
jgi:hypothetical protein